jgi:NADH-quinone oxidoreductase subunit F
MPKLDSAAELEKLRQEIVSHRDPNKPCIAICAGTGCRALGCNKVITAIKEEVKKQDLVDEVDIRETGCPGFCEKGTVVVIYPEGICYLHVLPEDVANIVSQTVVEKRVVDRLLYVDPTTNEEVPYEKDIPFYKNQMRCLIDNNSKLDPKSISDYIALGGYSALAKALSQMTPELVLKEVEKANLRGRGGGGFPAGRKWKTTRDAPDEKKYVVANCDEGDPGAFMDRALMEGNPHSVLEGLAIGAYAIGSREGYIYVRAEYPLAVENAGIAIRQAEEYRLLGEGIIEVPVPLSPASPVP